MNQKLIYRYISMFGDKHKLNFEKIINFLGIEFSSDFKEINEQARFDYLGSFEWFNTDGDTKRSAINMTQILRKEYNLPQNILFIADDGTSLFFMKCFGDHEEIYWITIEDVERFCKGEPLECKYDFFPTFPDFFKFLLDEEEKSRNETNQSST